MSRLVKYETKCRRCGAIHQWGWMLDSEDLQDFHKAMQLFKQDPQQWKCSSTECQFKVTIQDLVSHD